MDNLPHLRQKNTQWNTGRYRIDKLSFVLPEMQAGNAHQRKGFADKRHSKAGTLIKLCKPPIMGNTIEAVFLCLSVVSVKGFLSAWLAVCPAPATVWACFWRSPFRVVFALCAFPYGSSICYWVNNTCIGYSIHGAGRFWYVNDRCTSISYLFEGVRRSGLVFFWNGRILFSGFSHHYTCGSFTQI